jgi:limonene-1,2-epoxide hydrolase
MLSKTSSLALKRKTPTRLASFLHPDVVFLNYGAPEEIVDGKIAAWRDYTNSSHAKKLLGI